MTSKSGGCPGRIRVALCHFLWAMAAAFIATVAQAQGFPSRVITVFIPYPPGGPIDVQARMVAPEVYFLKAVFAFITGAAGAGGTERRRYRPRAG